VTLVLVATPLGNMADLSPRAASVLGSADTVACEDTRTTARLLRLAGIKAKRLVALHEHNEAQMVAAVLGLLDAGETVALVSDAGLPAISDPGERLVRAAGEAGHTVTVVPGPTAGPAALAISGLPTSRWVFEGFLPRKGADRKERLAALADEPRTIVLYEAPHRLKVTLADLVAACGEDRRVALVRELTKLHEEVWRGTLAEAAGLAREPRGEYVIVLDGSGPPAAVDDACIRRALADELELDPDRKAAIAAVALALKVPKRRVYDVAQANPGPGHVPRHYR
jgi:16S rRNA (cytidine1402-2'-O)-methyltransferase